MEAHVQRYPSFPAHVLFNLESFALGSYGHAMNQAAMRGISNQKFNRTGTTLRMKISGGFSLLLETEVTEATIKVFSSRAR